MKVAYFDCIGGASGNMILGALVDSGLRMADLQGMLDRLQVGDWQFVTRPVTRCGLGATWIDVEIPHGDSHRGLHDIERIIRVADLPAPITDTSLRIFTRLAQAEASVHRKPVGEVHFHEVGAVDAIIDIVGAATGLHLLGIDTVRCSPLPVGHGSIRCHHGILPNPPPATVELTRGVPLRPVDVEAELVTPTGAAILTTVAAEFGHRLPTLYEHVGYGAGTWDLPFPNLLRVLVGTDESGLPTERILMLETHIDDASPQIYEHVMEALLARGALDVALTPIAMKKSRPGVRVTVLGPLEARDALLAVLLEETPTMGVRVQMVDRVCLPRRMETVELPLGPVPVKLALRPDGTVLKAIPEYEVCRRLALEAGVPLQNVIDMARRAAEGRHTDPAE